MQKICAKIVITLVFGAFLLLLALITFLHYPIVVNAQAPDSTGEGVNIDLSSLFPFLLGVVGGAVASIINYFLTQRSEKRKANRDYQYQTLFRLYQECDPLIFQLARSSESALYKIKDIVEDSKKGDLNNEQRLSSSELDNYYRTNVIYRLLKSAAIFKLLDEKLTSYDFENEPRIKFYHDVSKFLFYSFISGKEIGKRLKIDYGRKDDERQDLRHSEVDILCELLIIREEKGTRIAQYEEFLEAWLKRKDQKSARKKAIVAINKIFTCFDPNSSETREKKTITWTILLIQAQIHLILQRNILLVKKGKFHPLLPSMWKSNERKNEVKGFKGREGIAKWRTKNNVWDEMKEEQFVYKYLSEKIENWSYYYGNSRKEKDTIPEVKREVSMETEVAFLICSENPQLAIDKIACLDSIAEYPLRYKNDEKIHDIYFDTPNKLLKKKGMALRLRRVDAKRWITLKGPSKTTEEGSVERLEIEEEWSEKALERMLNELLTRNVRVKHEYRYSESADPADIMKELGFVGVQYRTTSRKAKNIVDKEEEAQVLAELDIDSVTYIFGGQKVNLYEVEIELKHSGAAAVLKVAGESLLTSFASFLTRWKYSKVATGNAIERLLKQELKEMVDINGDLKPAAYERISDSIKSEEQASEG